MRRLAVAMFLSFAATVSLPAQCVLDQIQDKSVLQGLTKVEEADVDHDGITDVVLMGVEPLLYKGTIGGGFADAQPVSSRPGDVLALRDVNGDGNVDVIVGNGSSLGINLGDGHGGFTEKSWKVYGEIARMRAIGAGHFSGPAGNVDLIAGDQDGSIWTFKNHGDGTFDAPVKLELTGDMTTGDLTVDDLDGDGNDDVSFVEYPSVHGVTVLRSKGDGTFEKKIVTGADDVRKIAVADMDRDGIKDLVFVDGSSLYLARGLGGISYAAPVNLKVRYPVAHVALDDVNSDGILDLISDDLEGSRIAVAYGRGDGSFPSTIFVSAPVPLLRILNGAAGTSPLIHATDGSTGDLLTWKLVCSKRRAAHLN